MVDPLNKEAPVMRSPANIHVTQARTVLLATDNKNSVLVESAVGKANSIAYSAYGQQSARQEVATGLGFNGQMREAQIGWYLLGNGYRAYNPVLMRFHSPDSWSPFGGGGLNAYMYCVGDPVNASDPTGHIGFKQWIRNFFSRNTVTRTSSTSSLDPLIPSTSPAATRRTEPLPSIPKQMVLPNAGAPLDPITGEHINGHLPVGRRNWTPPSATAAPAEMKTFRELSQQQSSAGRSSTLASASASPPGPPVNRSNKPTNPARRNIPSHVQGRNANLNPATRPLPLTPDGIHQGLSIDSMGEVRVNLQVFTQARRRKN
jgi:RHS repeat-associated protein